ncbi:RNA polymerase sigma factor [Terrihabitans soli]|nr:sigma-70 family RNA polymerase sigma factor [Terrihabitans soli]
MAEPADIAALYLSESARLRRKVARMVGDQATAADLVHDIFLRLWRRAEPLDGNDAAYLTRSARNAAIDHLRAERIRSDFVKGTVPEQHYAGLPSPHAVLEAREGLTQVDTAIRGLPERTRHIFLLNRVHGSSYPDIAAAMGISPSAVEKHMARALSALRRAVEES